MQRQIVFLPRAWLAAVVLVSVLAAAGLWGRVMHTPPPVMPPGELAAAPESAAPPPAAAPAARRGLVMHRVLPGETVSGIAAHYNLDVDTVLAANPSAGELIHPDDWLVILPAAGVLHAVQDGDTVWGLARLYDVAADDILRANGKADANLAVGEKVFVPGARAAVAPSRGGGHGFAWPVRGSISSPYGYRWGQLHTGIDIADDEGTPVRAARAGRVASAGWRGGYGYAVVLDHGRGVQTLYGHLSDFAVQAGDVVRYGQVIGYVGSTGYSTGPHLHFEVIVRGQPVDPMEVLP